MPIDPGSDPRNRVRAHTSQESGELGDYELMTIECDIAKDTFDAARTGLKADMQALLDWIESNRSL